MMESFVVKLPARKSHPCVFPKTLCIFLGETLQYSKSGDLLLISAQTYNTGTEKTLHF